MSSVSVVVVAAGQGTRFRTSSHQPKQFQKIGGEPILFWSLRAFQKTPAVHHIVVVTQNDFIARVRSGVRARRLSKVVAVVPGGAERAESVCLGMAAVPRDTQVVLVHDAARPLVTPDIIQRVIGAAKKTGAALAAWPVPDTVKLEKNGGARRLVARTIPRRGLWLAQTPQGFRWPLAQKLFCRRRRPSGLTDDVQAAERAGIPVEIVLGGAQNIKVTYPEDLKICRAFLKK